MAISYTHKTNGEISVYLDGSKVGTIKQNRFGMWKYVPKGQTVGGKPMPDVNAVMRSIEMDADR